MGNARNAIASARENDMKNYRESVKLTVWYGSLPESNGKTNWTAILHSGDIASGMTIDQSEYPERVRYAADRVRWLIGDLDKEPWILDYDADKHSGYVAPTPIASSSDAVRDQEERETDEYVIKRLSEILAGVAVALKGPELPLHRHGYQDLVDIANALNLEVELYRANAVSPAPIASPDGKINEPHHIRRPVAYAAPFDLDVLAPGHQDSVKARLTRFPTRTRTVALYTTGHPAAAQPSRAEEACKLCNSTGHSTPCAYPTEINRQQAKRIAELVPQVETLALENQRLRVDAELMRQELKNIAIADTTDWHDPGQYEAWAKSRARWALGKVDKDPK
jgi:hypothetical protein